MSEEFKGKIIKDGAKTTDHSQAKKWIQTLTFHKNEFWMDHVSKCKVQSYQFLEENITEKSTWPWVWWWEIKWNTISMIHEKNVSYLQVSHPQIQPTTDWFDLQIQSLNCIFTEEWNRCMRRRMQFKPMLSKGQLYSIIQILELSGKAKL